MSNEPAGRTPLTPDWLEDLEEKACRTKPDPDRRAVSGTSVELLLGELADHKRQIFVLLDYVEHSLTCDFRIKQGPCDCGLSELLSRYPGTSETLGRRGGGRG